MLRNVISLNYHKKRIISSFLMPSHFHTFDINHVICTSTSVSLSVLVNIMILMVFGLFLLKCKTAFPIRMDCAFSTIQSLAH